MSETVSVALTDILISKPIAEVVKICGGDTTILIKNRGFKMDPFPAPLPLSKMNDVFFSSDPVPPIQIRRFKKGKYFQIVNGRHRVASAILLKKREIGAIIVE